MVKEIHVLSDRDSDKRPRRTGFMAALQILDDRHAVLEGRERCDVAGELGVLERLLPDG